VSAAGRHGQRVARRLPPVANVRDHILTDRPWLAADSTLAPWRATPDLDVFQPGAWILPDDRPLSMEVETFLAAGEAPLCVAELGIGVAHAQGAPTVDGENASSS
jgi:vancomycin aglycone glucosyltransferase